MTWITRHRLAQFLGVSVIDLHRIPRRYIRAALLIFKAEHRRGDSE